MIKKLLFICLIMTSCFACNESVERKNGQAVVDNDGKTADISAPIEQPEQIIPSVQPSEREQNDGVADAKSDDKINNDINKGELGNDAVIDARIDGKIGNDEENDAKNIDELGNEKKDTDGGIADSELKTEGPELENSDKTDKDLPIVEKEKAQAMEADGLPNLFRVSDELYRSGQPTQNGLISAEKLGIKTVLSFQILSFDTVLEESEQSGLILLHVPMIPTSVSEDNLVDALKLIYTAEKPVLVHCLHGSDRTGITVAMYRVIFQNWTKEEAKAEMTEEQFGYHEEFENLLELLDDIDVEQMKKRIFSENN